MKIKEIRQLTNLSQKKFCDKYGIPLQTLCKWEQGYRTCPYYVVELLEFKVREDLKMFGEFTLRNFLSTLSYDMECTIATNNYANMAKTILKEEYIGLDDLIEKWNFEDGKLLVWI